MPETIQVEYGGVRYTIPLSYQGTRVPPDDALQLFQLGLLKPLAQEKTFTPPKNGSK